MIVSRRALGLATACCVILAAGAAAAQTVIVTGAPPESAVELALNSNVIQTATAGEDGTATLAVNLVENRGRPETDVHVFVDSCDTRFLVSLVEPPLQPPAATAGCNRRELVGLFVVREITTMVVYVGGASPSLRVRQGRPPATWLVPGAEELAAGPSEATAPVGLVLSGGGGWSLFGDPNAAACGSLSDCSGKDAPLAYTASAAYWFTQVLGAEASYVKPGKVTASGSGTGFAFDTALETDVITLAGKVGIPFRIARIYGLGGATHHWATSTTTERIFDQTITVDETAVTVPGGTQVFTLNTKGWSWLFGAGAEVWPTPRFAIYGDFTYLKLKGENADGGEGTFDERAILLVLGARVKVF